MNQNYVEIDRLTWDTRKTVLLSESPGNAKVLLNRVNHIVTDWDAFCIEV